MDEDRIPYYRDMLARLARERNAHVLAEAEAHAQAELYARAAAAASDRAYAVRQALFALTLYATGQRHEEDPRAGKD